MGLGDIQLWDNTPKYFTWLLRACAAEFIGVALFVFLGVGAVTSTGMVDSTMTSGRLVAIAFAFGLGILITVSATASTSGGHINPAVSLAMVVTGRLTVVAGLCFAVSQCLGAVLGAVCVRAVTPSAFTAGLGVTGLGVGVSPTSGVLVEAILTFVLVFTIFGSAVNPHGPQIIAPLSIGFAVLCSHFIGVPLTGASLNPARSFGPAVIQGNFTNLWVYWAGPFLGAVVAAVYYELMMNPGEELAEASKVILTGEASRPTSPRVMDGKASYV